MNLKVNLEFYELLHQTAVKSRKALHFLLFLAKEMDEKNQYSESAMFIAEKLDCSSATVEKAVRVLAENNLIAVSKQSGRNLYTVNPEIFAKET
ncbi:MAG: replication/maintenance protein RepL [Oscillospiraceae bacterium]|nr:replication/maintenance protein RepL [Oscillospiraceae bacterium]